MALFDPTQRDFFIRREENRKICFLEKIFQTQTKDG